ncbi:MAG: M14 family zinc carboxypeptidase [Atribacterota bacterium]
MRSTPYNDTGIIDYTLALNFEDWLDLSYEDFMERLSTTFQKYVSHSSFEAQLTFLPEGKSDFITPQGRKIPILEIGNRSVSWNTLIFEATCHGGEKLHSVTLLSAFFSLLKEGKERNEVLKRAHLVFLPVLDPDGWHKGTRAYVDRSGEEVHTPVVVGMHHIRNLFGWEDTNAVFGRKNRGLRSRRVLALQEYLLRFAQNLKVYSSLHETVTLESELVYKNAGVMILVHDHFSTQEREDIARLRYPLRSLEKLECAIRKKLPFLVPKYRSEILHHYPSLQKTVSIRNYIRKMGLETFSDKFEALFREFPFFVERELPVCEGVYLLGPLFWKAQIALAPDFYQYHTGCVGRTIETFAQSRRERILQGLAFIDGTIRVEIKGERFDQ